MSFNLIDEIQRMNREEFHTGTVKTKDRYRKEILKKFQEIESDNPNLGVYNLDPRLELFADKRTIRSATITTRDFYFSNYGNGKPVSVYGIEFRFRYRKIFVGACQESCRLGLVRLESFPTKKELSVFIGSKINYFRYNKESYPYETIKINRRFGGYYCNFYQKNVFHFYFSIEGEKTERVITLANYHVHIERAPIVVMDTNRDGIIDRDML